MPPKVSSRRTNEPLDLLTAFEVAVGQIDEEKEINLDKVICDDTIQVRVNGLNQDVVDSYATIYREGGSLPAITVWEIEGLIYCSAGFHRTEAARRAGLKSIPAIVKYGTLDDAKEHAEDDNLGNALRLSLADKKHIYINRLERGHAWKDASFNSIAKVLGVTQPTIKNWYEVWVTSKNFEVGERVVVTSDGRTVNTTKIGSQTKKTKPTSDTQSSITPPSNNGSQVKQPTAMFAHGQEVLLKAANQIVQVQDVTWTGQRYVYMTDQGEYDELQLSLKPPSNAKQGPKIDPQTIDLYNWLGLAAESVSGNLRNLIHVKGVRSLCQMGPESLMTIYQVLGELSIDLQNAEVYLEWAEDLKVKILTMIETGQPYDAGMDE